MNNRISLPIIFLLVSNFILINISCASSNNLIPNKEDIIQMSNILKLNIELNKQVYSLEEPIVIQCTIINLENNTINLKPILFMDLEIHLKYENEKEIVPFGPKVLLKELLRGEDIIKLESGRSYSFSKTIDKKIYVMPSKFGRYELFAIYRNLTKELERIKLWTGEIKSNTVEFEIGRIKGTFQ